MPKVNTSWGKGADWYDEVTRADDSYQQKVILPNLLRLMDVQKNQTVLDVGCGTGFFSRALAALGAQVTGVDVGRELIAVAIKQNQAESAVNYVVASGDAMPTVKTASVDMVIIVLALQNIENAAGTMTEIARVLKPTGKLFIVLNHPTFRIPQASGWGWDEEKKIQYRRLDAYVSERKVKMQMHPGSDPSDITWSFHRPLQFYFKLFAKHGLTVRRLEEWTSHTRTPHGPRADAENRARVEFPLFLALEVVRLPEELETLDKKTSFV